jgi:hypothetical protein
MRPSVILTALGAAALILLPSIYFFRASPSPPPAPIAAKAETRTAAAPPPRTILIHPADDLPIAQDDRSSPSAPNHLAYVVERKAELDDMAATGDPAALRTILSELNNPDPGIRKAALVAAVDFGGQDAIPALRNEIAWAPDPQEKVDLQTAIDFLQLPPARPNASQSQFVPSP